MNKNDAIAHEIIRNAIGGQEMQSACIKILDLVSVPRAQDIIEDELDRAPLEVIKRCFQTLYTLELLKISTYRIAQMIGFEDKV